MYMSMNKYFKFEVENTSILFSKKEVLYEVIKREGSERM